MLGVSSVAGVSLSLIFGKLLDSVKFYKIVVPCFLFTGAAYISVPWLPPPGHPLTSALLIVSSAFVIGSTVLVTVMMVKSIGQEARGTIMGAYVFCGSLGVLIMTKVGGEIFDSIGPSAPFFLSGCLALLYSGTVAVTALFRPGLSLNCQ